MGVSSSNNDRMKESGKENKGNELLNKITSNYILNRIFSLLPLNIKYKLIKYNKNLQKKLNINFQDSIFNYQYIIKTKNEIMTNIEEMEEKLKSNPSKFIPLSFLSFSTRFCIRYSYLLEENLNEKDEKYIFLIKYKGFKINDYPLPFNFNSMNISEKIKFFEKNEYFLKYTLSNEKIELITLINEMRKKNNVKKLIYNKQQNLKDYFKEQKFSNEKYILKYPIGEFKKKLLKNDKYASKILLKKNLNYMMILEKERNEYINLYSNGNDKEDINLIDKTDNVIENNLENFLIINNTIPKININDSLINSLNIRKNLNYYICNKSSGFQILSFKPYELIGVLEGPSNTSYENGYFLFKMFLPKEYPMAPPQFCFLSVIFHPNISENGYVSVDILGYWWSPALSHFEKIIYSIQSLLDDPNPDNFLNENAANLYKKDRKIYDETVRKYTSLFANYSKFLEDIKNMSIKIETIKEGEKINKRKILGLNYINNL